MEFEFGITYALLWSLVMFQLLVSLGLVHELKALKARQAPASKQEAAERIALRVGSVAPAFSGTDLKSQTVDYKIVFSQTTALLFLSSGCTACKTIARELRSSHLSSVNVVVVCNGPDRSCKRIADRLQVSVPVIGSSDSQISEIYGIPSYPMLVVVDSEGRVRQSKKIYSLDDVAATLRLHSSEMAVESTLGQ